MSAGMAISRIGRWLRQAVTLVAGAAVLAVQPASAQSILRDAETEAHLIARKDRRMQGHAVRNQRDQQEKALARRHALLTLRNRCAGEDATAPEQHAEAGIKRGGNQMK